MIIGESYNPTDRKERKAQKEQVSTHSTRDNTLQDLICFPRFRDSVTIANRVLERVKERPSSRHSITLPLTPFYNT